VLYDQSEKMIKFQYKGISKNFGKSRKNEIEALRSSVYGEWYEFARLSSVLWCAAKCDLVIKDAGIKKVSNDFGNLWNGTFESWAEKTARQLFPEQKAFDEIEVLHPYELKHFRPTQQKFAISVPMTIRRATLIKQFRKLLDDHHPKDLDVLKVSHTAKYKLHTRQFRKDVLVNERLVLIYRLLYPKTQMWVIADRLQLSPSNHVRDEGFHVRRNKQAQFARLNSIAGRHLYKAKRRVMNAELGSFPNASDLKEPVEMPFGKVNHARFIELTTGEKGTEKTKWRKWLEAKYHDWLVRTVLRRNRVETPRLTDKDIKAFMSGKTHQI
jgi:hypothetical protein